jgi:hypothetical protein
MLMSLRTENFLPAILSEIEIVARCEVAKWGTHSYECDEVMDRVGDVWRSILDTLPADRVFSTIEHSFKQDPSAGLGLLLWRFCGIELPEGSIKRLGCLLTTDHRVAQAFLDKLDSRVLDASIREVVEHSPQTKTTLGGVVSFFVQELRASINNELRSEAARCLELQLSSVQTAQEKDHLSAEASSLRDG